MIEWASRNRNRFIVPVTVLFIILAGIAATFISAAYSEFTNRSLPISSDWLNYTFKTYHFITNPTGYGTGSNPAMALNVTIRVTSGLIVLAVVVFLALYSYLMAKYYIRDKRSDRAGVRRL